MALPDLRGRRAVLLVVLGLLLALPVPSAHGQQADAPAAAADQAGLGLYFGSPGGAVTVAPLSLPESPAALAVELRFKLLARFTGACPLVTQWAPTSKESDRGRFSVTLGSSGDVCLELLGAAGKPRAVRAHATVREGTWHHLLVSWDGTEVVFALDGKRFGSETIEGFGPLAASALPLVIGASPDPKKPGKGCLPGFISDVALWSVARGVEAGTVAAPLTGSEPGLSAFFPLREPASTGAVKDRAGKSGEAQLSAALARTGWCRTPWWFESDAARPYVHLFVCDVLGAEAGPAAVRQILVGNEARGEVGVLWQDATTQEVRVTWMAPNLEEMRTIPLKGMTDGTLAAGAAGPRGELVFLMIQTAGEDNADDASLRAALYLAAPDGKPLRELPLDTSQDHLNITAYGGRWVGSMAYSKDTICFILPRRMHRSADGLQHQGGVAATCAADLSRFQILGQTSGHSFGNLLTVNARGEFIGLDLGDNYPRGVHLHRITRANLSSSVVFTYKTAHATTPGRGFPVYPEISRTGKTFYKWSNDNNTYTELGGVVEGKSCMLVAFATDRSPEGKVLDCSRIGVTDEPRDLVLMRVQKNFERGSGGPKVSDSVLVGLPPGATAETGGYFDFAGNWVEQRVTGMVWLTHYPPGEAAHAPQLMRRRDGSLLLLWEKSGPDGASLWAMGVDENAKPMSAPIRLGMDLRLVPEGVPLRLGERIFTLATDARGGGGFLCFVRDE